ncbi:MAG: hypothetical protein A2Z99_16835 [Treponema sp. GWB1_62_6]|nr:MAG: hypothetical protein A2001_15545 [Treponema sp. GWC1_61_84]OHE65596.1 MAG: hypothetical protein A2Z99_16835 [Treponema sp. GWB1_62_6]OHE76786.1 MAG: hypothetical protein A2413_15750 [Treponema sp. RIFOXYC1_FULL_61_9]HCM26861.1 sugar phosphate isomerase/epimerase [Treponema sp.]
MELGCRAHDFGKLAVAELAKKIREKGFSHAQLALAKAIADVDAGPGKLNAELAGRIAETWRREGVRISVLGSYFNPVGPDLEERERGAGRFMEQLRFAGAFGCPVVATETGSLNADWSAHPDNGSEAAFALFVETMRPVAAEAERRKVFACIEGVVRHVILSPARLRRALDELASPGIRVLLDPVNFLDENNYEDRDRIIEESFELFGDLIVTAHIKDFAVRKGQIEVVPAGSGLMDYGRLFRLLKALPRVDVILEDLRPEAMEGAARFVREAWEKA